MSLMYLDKKKEYFDEKGYVIVDLNYPDSFYKDLINDVDTINNSQDKKLNPKIYHYNKHPRLIEGWKKSDNIKQVALDRTLIETLKYLYNREPIPFSTINFTRGTEQPLHSDYFHFGSMPELFLAGVWVALEDIHPDSGPLSVVPYTHKSPIVLPSDLGIVDIPKNIGEVKKNYSIYEDYVRKYIDDNDLKLETPILKQGQALIWAANTFHGAGKIKNSEITRYSQVTHYHFEGLDFCYNPNFSSREKYVYRDVEVSRIK